MLAPALIRSTSGVKTDAFVRRTLDQLKVFTDWLAANNARGYIGEFGWPYNTSDTAKWNMLAHHWYLQADKHHLWVTPWAAGRAWGTYALGQYVSSNSSAINVARASTVITEGHATTPQYQRGVNLAGAEFGASSIAAGGVFSNLNPGVVDTDYFYPLPADYAFLASHGVKLIRLPVRWERVQPTLLGALDSNEVGRISAVLAGAHAQGMSVIIDVHNFASYVLGTDMNTATTQRLSTNASNVLHTAHLTDLWTKLSSQFNGVNGLAGYGLMNEPTGMMNEVSTTGTNIISNPGFETNTNGWSAQSSSTIARSTTANFVRTGTGSLFVQSTSGGTMSTYASGNAVTGGQPYQVKAFIKSATTPRTCYLQVDWRTNSGYISSSFGNFPTSNTSTWTQLELTATAPANATVANIGVFVQNTQASEVHYVDDVSLYRTTSVLTPQQQWEQISQAALTAIRNNGDTSRIFVPGYGYSHVHTWSTNHPSAWITDPADNFWYEGHHYMDNDHSGAYGNSYATEVTNATGQGY